MVEKSFDLGRSHFHLRLVRLHLRLLIASLSDRLVQVGTVAIVAGMVWEARVTVVVRIVRLVH